LLLVLVSMRFAVVAATRASIKQAVGANTVNAVAVDGAYTISVAGVWCWFWAGWVLLLVRV